MISSIEKLRLGESVKEYISYRACPDVAYPLGQGHGYLASIRYKQVELIVQEHEYVYINGFLLSRKVSCFQYLA